MKTIHNNVTQESIDGKTITRSQIELLRSRLDLLCGKDKFLMTLYLEDGYSIFQISKLTDIAEAKIKRRIDNIIKRLISGRYIECLHNRSKFKQGQMAIAKDYFLTGLSIREIAYKRNWSIYKVREAIIKIKDILNECECINAK
ncbi:MAG: sigma-70 family RNA polymerase sigma factor [Sedimentisphaerales bacterium]|nr:sigma-70 family RNA polymerase sigma factor [Sedimentisphaerales bacterium]